MPDEWPEAEVLNLGIHYGSSGQLRHLFVKRHVAENEHVTERCLFVVGIPAGAIEDEFVELFSKFGVIERAAMHSSRTSALVIFESDKAMEKILKAIKRKKTFIWERKPRTQPFGLKAWVKAHKDQKPGNKVLEKQLDEWMEAYEEREAQEKAAALSSMQEDGWTVVQRHKGRKKNTNESSGVTVGAVAAAAAQEIAKRKRARVHENFYAFQKRDQRKSGTYFSSIS